MPFVGPRDPDEQHRVARKWTVREANARLEGLRVLLPELRGMAHRLGHVQGELERLTQFWGKEIDALDHPDRALRDRLKDEASLLHERLEREVRQLSAEGIEVKDLDTGLIDFYALMDQEPVLLCWRRDEPAVEYYHSLTGGYRSRRPIPAPAGEADRSSTEI